MTVVTSILNVFTITGRIKPSLGLISFLLILSFAGYSQDLTPPAPVTIKYVTVNPSNNNVTISWNPSSSVDVDGYEIWKLINGYYIKIDDVSHPTTTYTNTATPVNSTSSLADSQSESYRITAYDGAFPTPNVSELSPPHHTIYLEYTFKPCYGEVNLVWNKYEGWNSGVFQYEIYRAIGTGPYSMIASVEGNKDSYKDRNIDADLNYFYYVKAIDGANSKSSSSNNVKVYTDMPHPPVTFNADYASVSGENLIDLRFTVDPSADVTRYTILRADSLNGEFEPIATLALTEVNAYNKLKYTDHINTDAIHYYVLQAINTCDVPFNKTTNIASNIVAKAQTRLNMTNVITWNNYYNWLGEINYYEVYRIADNDTALIAYKQYGDTILVDNLEAYLEDPQNSPYFDPASYDPNHVFPSPYLEQPELTGKFCYYIKAREKDNPFGLNSTSLSSTTCVNKQPVFWVPNAFTPNYDGANDYFIPYLSFGGVNSYHLQIFDRWGLLLFETKDLREPWNGRTADGKSLPVGVYIYIIDYSDSDGNSFQKTGEVTLVK